MARYWFGATVVDWTLLLGDTITVPGVTEARQAIVAGGVVVTGWNLQEGGTRYTDLVDAAGQAVDAITTPTGAALGQIPALRGPDGVREMWVSANDGPRVLMVGRVDAVDRAGDRMTGPLFLADGSPAVSESQALLSSGGTMTGPLTLSGPPTGPLHAATRQFAEELLASGAGPVSSVNGETGAVILAAADVGAAPTAHTHTTTQVTGLDTALAGKAAAVHDHPGKPNVYLHDGVSYVLAAGAGHYIGGPDPGNVANGSVWDSPGGVGRLRVGGDWVPPLPPPAAAPLAPFTAGTDVGVPTGTTLTDRATLGAATGLEELILTHPVTGATAILNVQVWEAIRFTATINLNVPTGQTWLFRDCKWAMPGLAFWCVEVAGGSVPDQMQPLAVFERCTFDGAGQTARAVAGHYFWLIGCDVLGMLDATPAGAADAVQGAAYSVVVDSNLIAGTDVNNPDPHSDGIQSTDTGRTTLYHCWVSAGRGPGANAAVRVGSEAGPNTAIEVVSCAIDGGGWAMQMDGSGGGGAGITNVKVKGCRWTNAHAFGPVDFVNTTVAEWTDNAYFDGTSILNPVP